MLTRTETRPGIRTTEFWLVLLTALGVWVDAVPLPEKYEGWVIPSLALGYALARGLSKLGVEDVKEVSDERTS